ncbi:hypothetical protein TrST_g12156 [Triparma strigata]|uniref:Uncharacterized protein n=1 Tax=Triparma strigata TaxID=1606541 RepID=A0A9W7B593_9STRA|nr:hypothetical protein TrST_g12156 [Triparma strigata]
MDGALGSSRDSRDSYNNNNNNSSRYRDDRYDNRGTFRPQGRGNYGGGSYGGGGGGGRYGQDGGGGGGGNYGGGNYGGGHYGNGGGGNYSGGGGYGNPNNRNNGNPNNNPRYRDQSRGNYGGRGGRGRGNYNNNRRNNNNNNNFDPPPPKRIRTAANVKQLQTSEYENKQATQILSLMSLLTSDPASSTGKFDSDSTVALLNPNQSLGPGGKIQQVIGHLSKLPSNPTGVCLVDSFSRRFHLLEDPPDPSDPIKAFQETKEYCYLIGLSSGRNDSSTVAGLGFIQSDSSDSRTNDESYVNPHVPPLTAAFEAVKYVERVRDEVGVIAVGILQHLEMLDGFLYAGFAVMWLRECVARLGVEDEETDENVTEVRDRFPAERFVQLYSAEVSFFLEKSVGGDVAAVAGLRRLMEGLAVLVKSKMITEENCDAVVKQVLECGEVGEIACKGYYDVMGEKVEGSKTRSKRFKFGYAGIGLRVPEDDEGDDEDEEDEEVDWDEVAVDEIMELKDAGVSRWKDEYGWKWEEEVEDDDGNDVWDALEPVAFPPLMCSYLFKDAKTREQAPTKFVLPRINILQKDDPGVMGSLATKIDRKAKMKFLRDLHVRIVSIQPTFGPKMVASGGLKDLVKYVKGVEVEGADLTEEETRLLLISSLFTFFFTPTGISPLTTARILYQLGQDSDTQLASSFNTMTNLVASRIVEDAELISTTSREGAQVGIGMWACFANTLSKTLLETWNKATGPSLNMARGIVRECVLRCGEDAVYAWSDDMENLKIESKLGYTSELADADVTSCDEIKDKITNKETVNEIIKAFPSTSRSVKAAAVFSRADAADTLSFATNVIKANAKLIKGSEDDGEGEEIVSVLWKGANLRFGIYLKVLVAANIVSLSDVCKWLTGLPQPTLVSNAWIFRDVEAAMSTRCRIGDNVDFDDDDEDDDLSDDEMALNGPDKEEAMKAQAVKDVLEGLYSIISKASPNTYKEGSSYAVGLRCGAINLVRVAFEWKIIGRDFEVGGKGPFVGDLQAVKAMFY